MEISEKNIEIKKSMNENREKLLNAGRVIVIIVIGLILIFSIIGLGLMSSYYSSQQNSIRKNGYGESCLSNQCQDTQLLQCISGKCQCTATSSWNIQTQKCVALKLESRFHGSYCKQGYTQCQNNTKCINSICQCDTSTYYWTGSSCVLKLYYNSACSVSLSVVSKNCVSDIECNQCLTSSFLTCDSVLNKCLCSSSIYYYDSSLAKCSPFKTYYTSCTSSLECDSSVGLFCQNTTSSQASNCPAISIKNKCDCQNNQYYDPIYSKCLPKKSFNRPCLSSCECDNFNRGLECYSGLCMCPKSKYFNSDNCVASNTGYYNSICSTNLECNSKLGLICSNISVCDCVLTTNYYWNPVLKFCIECPLGWSILTATNGISKCYFISIENDTWTNASKLCQYDNSLLLYIKDVYEYNVLFNYLSTYYASTSFHIGLYANNYYYYYWTDNTYIAYSGSSGCNILLTTSLFYFPSYGYCCHGCFQNTYGTINTNVPSMALNMNPSGSIQRYICKKTV